MLQAAVDNARICNKGDNAHAGSAGEGQRVGFEDLPDQARPRAPGLPEGSVSNVSRIVTPGQSTARRSGGQAAVGLA